MSRSQYRVYKGSLKEKEGEELSENEKEIREDQTNNPICLAETWEKKKAIDFFKSHEKKNPDHNVALYRYGKKSRKWHKVDPEKLL